MRFKKFFQVGACAFTGAMLLLGSPARAADVVIAVVDVHEIMTKSAAALSASSQLEKRRRAFEEEAKAKQQDFGKQYQDIMKQKSVLSASAMDQKMKDYDRNLKSEQRKFVEKSQTLKLSYDRAVNEIEKGLSKAVAGLAKEKHFTVAMDSSKLIYAQDAMDITQDVMTRLNRDLPSLNVDKPTQ